MLTHANTIPNIVVQRTLVYVNGVTVPFVLQKAVQIVASQSPPILQRLQRQSQRRLRLVQIILGMRIRARCIRKDVVQRMMDCVNGAILQYVKAKADLIVVNW